MIIPSIDLKARARRAIIEAGFQPDFSPEIQAELHATPAVPASSSPAVRDLRSLLWSSIDNQESRDLDQVEYAEPTADGGWRLLVGIADVDAVVPKGTATDRRAAANATTVYAGVAIFPMLPLELSTDRTSLLGDCDRQSVIVELRVQASGDVDCHDVYPALLRNRAKLAYGSTGAWLEGKGPMPPAIAAVSGMEAQLRLQLTLSQTLRELRKRQGVLAFASSEANPVIENGRVTEMTAPRHSVADDIIESFMVAANVAMAQHLKARGLPALRRVVRTPKRWDRIQVIAGQFGVKLPSAPDPKALADFLDQRHAADPDHFPDLSLTIVKLLGPGEYIVETPGQEHEGHFGLAVQDYTHSTAPNRRFADLVTQRLLKAVAAGGGAPYRQDELNAIAARCTDRENEARKVARLMRKIAACDMLRSRIGEMFDGIVTGASPKGTYARLLGVPAEGRVVRGAQGVDVGDKVRLRLAAVDVDRGFIDLERPQATRPGDSPSRSA
jgi:VacB/RNase II family 3'-5' exoribonuclease